MKSDNPHSGCYIAKTARTLDLNGGNPACNQGGMIVCGPAICFQQNQRDEVRDMGESAGALTAERGMHNQNYLCYGIDCRNAALDAEKAHTLQAKANGGISLNCTPCVLYQRLGGGETISIEGNGCRPSHKGSGYSIGDKMFTLNATECHAVCYDARGNGNGYTVPTLTGDHENRITDYSAVVVEAEGCISQNSASASTFQGGRQAR